MTDWTILLARLNAINSDALHLKEDQADTEAYDACEAASDAIGEAAAAVRAAIAAIGAVEDAAKHG